MAEFGGIEEEYRPLVAELDAMLCLLNQRTGREYSLFLVPEELDEPIHVSLSGKPVTDNSVPVVNILEMAMHRRVKK